MEKVLGVAPLLLLFAAGVVLGHPSRPLNERSTELAWQAWLLVDDQNQNRQNNPEGMLRRRITPKSIFIAPTFSPESLPACAEGYRPDSMGRCISFIKIDADAQLDFLLRKLNEKFGRQGDDADDDEDGGASDEEEAATGPFQVNIPLDLGAGSQEATSGEEAADVAIVVAPTNGNFDVDADDGLKLNFKRTREEATTEAGPETTAAATEEASTTAAEDAETTATATATAPTTTEALEEGTQQALFFWEPLKSAGDALNDSEDAHAATDSTEKTTTPQAQDDFQTTTLADRVVFPSERHVGFVKFPEARPSHAAEHQGHGEDVHDAKPKRSDFAYYNRRNRDKMWYTASATSPKLLRIPYPLKYENLDGFQRRLPPEELSYIFGKRRRRKDDGS